MTLQIEEFIEIQGGVVSNHNFILSPKIEEIFEGNQENVLEFYLLICVISLVKF